MVPMYKEEVVRGGIGFRFVTIVAVARGFLDLDYSLIKSHSFRSFQVAVSSKFGHTVSTSSARFNPISVLESCRLHLITAETSSSSY